MNNSYNYSHLADLLTYKYTKEKQIHRSEKIEQENTLSIEDLRKEEELLALTSEKE